DIVEHYSANLVRGMMNLLYNCPPCVTNMRKEFFIAARHILSAQEIRPKFLDVLDELMNEDILIGQGYTVRDALRPLAYSTLADLTHHIRNELSLAKIARAVDLYGRNMHDDTLPFSIQQMSLRLLLNLVECIRQRAVAVTTPTSTPVLDSCPGISSGTARHLLLQILCLCVLKARVVTEHYLPALEAICTPELPEAQPSMARPESVGPSAAQIPNLNESGSLLAESSSSDTLKTAATTTTDSVKTQPFLLLATDSSRGHLSHADLRSLIKALMTGVRTIVMSMIQCPRGPASAISPVIQPSHMTKSPPSPGSSPSRFLSSDELALLSEYFNYGMRMIDIVQIVSRDGKLFIKNQPSAKSPEERLLIETFALTFSQLSPVSFHEIFSSKIHDFVSWCRQSPSYTNMALHLLSQPNKTSNFCHILLSYLVDRLERLGEGTDESVLYMRLLKLCFSSVNMAGTENEHVMKLHLRRIVLGSMQHCITATEPTAYLTLLRMLFRSIGGGAHDKLYREFFPLLPEMLTTLNRLLRSPHRANARDLLGELCVIVPVRLSTLLPYLSLLMEPLIYVLNCSTVNQGLRTLELCVDNMQPDFLHDHLCQVRGDMLLALYNSLHSSSEYVQKMSFKVLGKLGHFNRTNLIEVQRLRLDPSEGESGPQVRFYLAEYPNQPIDLPIRSLVDAAIESLQSPGVDLPTNTFIWDLLQSLCIASLDLPHKTAKSGHNDDAPYAYFQTRSFLLSVKHYIETVTSGRHTPRLDRLLFQSPCCLDGDVNKDVMIRVLAGIFLAGLHKSLREKHGDFITYVVRHLTLVSLSTHMTTFECAHSSKFTIDPSPFGRWNVDEIGFSGHMNPSCVVMEMVDKAATKVAAQQAGVSSTSHVSTPSPDSNSHPSLFSPHLLGQNRLDPTLLIDAILFAMGHEDKQLTQPMTILLQVIHATLLSVFRAASDIIVDGGSDDANHVAERNHKAIAHLPLFTHLAHVCVDMLHHPAWYVKWSGCATIMCIAQFLHPCWFALHMVPLLRGLLHAIHDLSDQMSQGALNMARDCTRLLLRTVFTPSMMNDLVQPQHPTSSAHDDVADRTASGKRAISTSLRRSQQPHGTGVRRQTSSLRRGRSASTSISGTTSESSTESARREHTAADNTPSSSQPLVETVVVELMTALLSETSVVREEARCLLRLVSHLADQSLSTLLTPHWQSQLGHILPPHAPSRLLDFPLSTQLVILEANYFFGQPEVKRCDAKQSDPADLSSGGAGLLRYDVTRRSDRCFLIDVRALLTHPEPSSSPPGNGVSTANTSATESYGSALNHLVQPGSASKAHTTRPNAQQLRSIDLRIAACRVLSLTWYLTSQKSQNLAALFKGINCDSDVIHEAAFVCLKEFVSHTNVDIELRHANVKPILQNIRQAINLRLVTARQLSYCAQLFPSTFSERLCDAIYSHLNTLVDSLPSKQNISSVSTLTPPTLELCAVLIDLFHLIPLATAKHVSLLIELVMRAERSLNIEPTSPLRLPLVRFLARYPAETCVHLLTGSRWPHDAQAQRLFLYVLRCPQGQAVVEYLKTNHHILSDLVRPNDLTELKASGGRSLNRYFLPRTGTPLTAACPRHLALRTIHTLHKLFPNWLLSSPLVSEESSKTKSRHKTVSSSTGSKSSTTSHPVADALLDYWKSDTFAKRQACLTLITLSGPGSGDPEAISTPGAEFLETEGKLDHRIISASLQQSAETLSSSLDPGSFISSGTVNIDHWEEPRLVLDCLLDCYKSDTENFDLLFALVVGVARLRSVAGLHPLRLYLTHTLFPTVSFSWHRRLFLHFVASVRGHLSDSHCSPDLRHLSPGAGSSSVVAEDIYRLLAHLIIPSFGYALERGPIEEFLGGPPAPLEMNDSDLVHVFVTTLLSDPAMHSHTELRVMCYQLAILIVYHAPEYVHSEASTERSYRLERLIDFAWPCTLSSLSVVDLQEKYTGLHLLAHIIAKFPVAQTMAVQVFQCLAKGTHTETKKIVNPALDVLIPAWIRTPEDQKLLASVTRKIMLEDHGIQSCIHLLGIVVRHADLYYPVRYQLLPHILVIISRLSTQQLPVEQRRLALDMIDAAARWDHRCRQHSVELDGAQKCEPESVMSFKDEVSSSTSSVPTPEDVPMQKTLRDQLLTFMIRFACQAVDTSQNGNLSELSVARALAQLEFALRPDVWGTETCDLRLVFIERCFASDDASSVSGGGPSASGAVAGVSSSGSNQAPIPGGLSSPAAGPGNPNSGSHPGAPGNLGATQTTNFLMILEVLRVLFTSLEGPTLLSNVKYFCSGLYSLLTRQLTNVRLMRSCSNLLRAILTRFPADASHRQKITTHVELFDIYSATLKTIQESFTLYSENGPKSTLLARLQSAFLLFTATQVQTNPHAFVDRCIVQLVKLTHRLIQDVVTPGTYLSGSLDSGASSQLTDLLISSLEVIKSRLNVVSHEMRKNSFGPDLCLIMERARDARLFRAVIKILRDWINVPKSEEHFAPTPREKVNFFHKLWLAHPRWLDLAPDVAREILECIYEVYISGSLFKTQDLYLKLEQAFCCSLLSTFPDIRERFVSLYLEASQLRFPIRHSQPESGQATHSDCGLTMMTGELESDSLTSSPHHTQDGVTDGSDILAPSGFQSASLLVRLLFLFVSVNWDEAHFRNSFWLPLFFDVLLCDVDTSLPPGLSSPSSCFPSVPAAIVGEITEPMDTSEAGHQSPLCSASDDLSSLLELQSEGFLQASRVSFSDGLRGLLCLVHRSPALATQLFTQLWPQLWNRLLLRQPMLPNGELVDGSTRSLPGFTSTPFSDEATTPRTMEAESILVADSHSGQNLSVNEVRAFVIPQLIRFITSDQHVNPGEPQPSALGAFLSALATTPDTALVYLPIPAVTYIGSSYNQWYTVALFVESVCAHAKVQSTSTDFVYNVSLPPIESADPNTLTLWQPSDLPTGTAALSLVALYDSLADEDYLNAAWWNRFALNRSALTRTGSMLRCLEYAQHGHTVRALEVALDLLAIPSSPSTPVSSAAEGSSAASTASSNRAAASRTTPSSTTSPMTAIAACSQFSDHVNRSRLHDYCIRYLKRLGQWDSLSSFASNAQANSFFSLNANTPVSGSTGGQSGPTSSASGSSSASSGAAVGTSVTASGTAVTTTGSGGSACWGIKADAAWRRSDWSEVYSSLARLANECPRNELCRYALIQGTACVAGRRASGPIGGQNILPGTCDLDACSTSGTIALNGTGDLQVSTSSGSISTGGGSSVVGQGSTTSSANVNYVVTLLQASELESHRIMTTVLREWRRLPLIVTRQHVPLLQIAHRAIEISEGNSLLAQYCGHLLAGPAVPPVGLSSSGGPPPYSSATGQSTSATPSSASGASPPSSQAALVALRMPLNQALHDYKTVFKSWQSRHPSISDDLGFWHDVYSWRQVVEETIISCHPHMQKFGQERTHLVALCERELALSQLQLARGARKHRFPSIAQQHLDRYNRMNLPPLFEKTKQEVKLKMFELRKDELLEGLELMEKTNIQQYEKKDRAKFFCYKAVFFSHFNKGDEATKNFGYATQMQDNLHKVWSVYGDFLENVYSSYPAAKREVAVSTTGIFAMQALMEAASIAGGLERRSRADIAKCLWLLTLDDAKGQQRLARTFEERSSRVRSEAFLSWLPNLVTSLLRPEGRFILPALRGVINTHPTVLYGLLRGLQHQLSTELRYDERLGQLSHGSEFTSPFAQALRFRINSVLGTISAEGSDKEHGRGSSGLIDSVGTKRMGTGSGASTCKSTGAGGIPSSPTSQSSLPASKRKKRVIVVMRGVEGERRSGSPLSPSQTKALSSEGGDTSGTSRSAATAKKAALRNMGTADQEREAMECAEAIEAEDEADDAETEREELESGDGVELTTRGADSDEVSPGFEGQSFTKESPSLSEAESRAAVSVGTGCLSSTVAESLHRINLLLNQLRRRHAARIYSMDLFTNEVSGRLQPSWAEHLLAQLYTILDYLHRFVWAATCPGNSWRVTVLDKLCVPNWLATEMKYVANACGLPITSPLKDRHHSGENGLNEDEDEIEVTGTFKELRLMSVASPSGDPPDSIDPIGSGTSSESEMEVEEAKAVKKQQTHDADTKRKPQSSGRPGGSGLTIQKTHLRRLSTLQSTAATPAFQCAERLITAKLIKESQEDPFFPCIRERLSNEFGNLEGQTVLSVIRRLTQCWIPLLEERVARLPSRMHLSDCGAARLLELPKIVISTPLSVPAATINIGTSSYVPTFSFGSFCLELPGESGILQSGNPFHGTSPSGPHSSSFGQPGSTTPSGFSGNGAIPNLALQLVIAEILPNVVRVRHSPGRMSPPSRRIGIRGSNGRVFYYDLACPGCPIAPGTSAIHLAATAGARTQDLILARGRASILGHLASEGLCSSVYTSWRQMGPLHLFQMVNTMLASQPETAKRQLVLSVPRVMEVGPMGLRLTEVGSSAPAAVVDNANANPLPYANALSARGLTSLTRPPPLTASSACDGNNSTPLEQTTCPTWALTINHRFQPHETDTSSETPRKSYLPPPPPGPLPTFLSTAGSTLSSNLATGGTSAVAAEAIGRPSGLDAGCHPATVSLSGVLEQACSSWMSAVPTASSSHSSTNGQFTTPGAPAQNASQYSSPYVAGAGNLICMFYEKLSQLNRHPNQIRIDAQHMCKLFEELATKIPGSVRAKSPLVSTLGILPDYTDSDGKGEETPKAEFSRGSLLRRWAANRMLDSESYWLFRHTIASCLGLINLMEYVFHLVPLHPGCLLLDPRSGLAEARHTRFVLPSNCCSSGAEQPTTGAVDKVPIHMPHLASCFIQTMGLRIPKTSVNSSSSRSIGSDSTSLSDHSSPLWRITPSPVPFRLTPHLAGLVCLPGTPPHIGPFGASFTTAAQALANTQRSHSLASLYRAVLRNDYILWHRGRQAAVHAFQLMMDEQIWTTPEASSDSDSDDAELGCKRKNNKLFDELGVAAPLPVSMEPDCAGGTETQAALVPDLTNEQLIHLITFTVDAMNTSIRNLSDYSGSEPNAWNLIAAATDPSNLAQMSPDWLPWL
ncbi:unnamed protein product, partial [Dicrocoelium dendriticum]